jgi:membrane protease YdiL (CAAX protease family)
MPTVNPNESSARQPNPWLSLLLVIATVGVAFFLPGRWITRNYLLLQVVEAFIVVVVFALYTFHYGGVQQTVQRGGSLRVLMIAAPWLFAVVNVWGKVVPSVLFTSAALTALGAALTVGVAEELLFRGMLFRAFRGRSAALYVLVSSLTFGLCHYPQGYLGVMTTLVVGSSYALARVAGVPLSVLMVCHSVTDFPNLLPHTPHPQYGLVAFVVVVVASALPVAFISRRANWTILDGEKEPAPFAGSQ